jgi:hypothetical protein
MKPKWLVGMLLFSMGCEDARDAKISKLEQKVSQLEVQAKRIGEGFTNVMEIVQTSNTNTLRSLSNMMAAAQISNIEMQWFMDDLRNTLTNTARTPAAPPAQRPVYMRSGVPVIVYNQIAAAAAREWPGDYNMQEFTIRTQIESYRKLNP